MARSPIWCALGASALLAMSTPLYAAPLNVKAPDAWAAPNVFGTIALQVAKSPYDAKWRHAAIGSRGPSSKAARPAFRDLATVQQDVNHRLSYRADSPQLGDGDVWSAAANTLARGWGDCEDYAIAKGHALLALGFLPQDLYLVIGNDLALRSDHAVLVVRLGDKFWVLDNLSRQVVDADQFRDFAPVMTLSADRKWVHGYGKGARQRLANVRPRSPGFLNVRVSAIKVAQGN